jgi:hypothetical protein
LPEDEDKWEEVEETFKEKAYNAINDDNDIEDQF